MDTVESLARNIAGIAGLESEVNLVGLWISDRYVELANANTLRSLRRTSQTVIPAPFTQGTISVTEGSQQIVGVATNWTADLEGQYLRQKTNWYRIANVLSPLELRLETIFTEGTATEAGYAIINQRHKLPADRRKLGPFRLQRLRRTILPSTKEGLDHFDPSRFNLNSAPEWIVEQERDADNNVQIEVYPYSRQDELFDYVYWERPKPLDWQQALPQFIDPEAMREGVLIDVYRHKIFKAAAEDDVNKAGLFRNEFRAQETRWERDHKHRLLRQDDALDDLEMVLLEQRAHPGPGNASFAIVDARTSIWAGDR